MSDLISRSALIEHIKDVPTWMVYDKNPRKYPVGMYDPEDVISSIENAPTIEAEPVVHGEILWNDDVPHCSVCKKVIHGASAYCNHCGASMKGSIDYDSGKSN